MRAHDEESGRALSPTVAQPDHSNRSPPDRNVIRLQRSAGNGAVTSLLEGGDDRSLVLDVVGSGGSPLDAATRAEMEASFGRDFADVRIHTGSVASDAARSVQAQAYTVGNHVVFGEGYNAESVAGRHTLAHELTHVVQQRSGSVDGTPAGPGILVSDPADRFELEAEATADRLDSTAEGDGSPSQGATELSLQRQEESEDNDEY